MQYYKSVCCVIFNHLFIPIDLPPPPSIHPPVWPDHSRECSPNPHSSHTRKLESHVDILAPPERCYSGRHLQPPALLPVRARPTSRRYTPPPGPDPRRSPHPERREREDDSGAEVLVVVMCTCSVYYRVDPLWGGMAGGL